jgi:hypothetical protein
MRDNGNGTVADTVTGLIWMKQANCINQTWASAITTISTLASGQCGLTDDSTAGSWRMPNRHEMLSLSDRGLNNHADYFDTSWVGNNPTINSQSSVFNNFIQFQYYWTSTTNAADIAEARTAF